MWLFEVPPLRTGGCGCSKTHRSGLAGVRSAVPIFSVQDSGECDPGCRKVDVILVQIGLGAMRLCVHG
jgi:hypothetical protein